MKPYMAIDIETTGLDWCKCGIIGIGSYCKDLKLREFGKEIQYDPEKVTTIYHNGSFDIKVARRNGIILPYDHDTILMASLLQYADNVSKYATYDSENEAKLQESLALDNLAIRDLGVTKSWKIDWDKDKPSYDEIMEHCLMDCMVTYNLFETYKKKLEDQGLWKYYNNLLMPLARLLIDVECTGIRLDTTKLAEMKVEYGTKIDSWSKEFHETHKEALDVVIRQIKFDKMEKVKPGKKAETLENRKKKILHEDIQFNPRSSVHMSKLLELKGINIVDKTGKKTTASKLLYRYRNDPIIGSIVEYKKSVKIYNDFLCKWSDMLINDILYTNILLWRTRTGRLSSAEPNLQQVPKKSDIRNLFIAREGMVLTVADAKQLEARLAAFFSKETKLINAFNNNIDIYGQIAIDLLGLDCTPNEVKDKYPNERQIGKQLFLATLYGQGSNSLFFILTRELQVNITLDECKKYKRIFNQKYPNLQAFAEECKATAEGYGYITTWFGRKISIPRDKGYKAINYYIQGSGSDLIGFSQLNVVPRLPNGARLILLVHDEIVIEHPPEHTKEINDIIMKYMVQSIRDKYNIPIDMEIKTGNTWGIK